ncbi:alpha/beta fold hydrolase [Streptomyces varsoviensis]|nr:alpha/beta hydrolase [Streptomyces varsoviensis]
MTTLTAAGEEIIPLTFGGLAYEGRIVHRPGARLAPVVLVGGAFQTKAGWGRVEQGFLAEATVITMDLPGGGDADRLPPECGFDFLTGALDHLLTSVAPGPVNVFGASYGSAVAYRWAQLHPERCARLLLFGTMAQMTEHVRGVLQRSLDLAAQGRHEEFVGHVLDGLVCLEPDAAIARRNVVIRCLTSMLNNMTADELDKYRDNTTRLLDYTGDPEGEPATVPILVATGEYDPLTTPLLSRAAAARCGDARFTTIKGADHMAHLERPAEVVDLAVRFFDGRPLGGLDYCGPIEYFGRTGRLATVPPGRVPER